MYGSIQVKRSSPCEVSSLPLPLEGTTAALIGFLTWQGPLGESYLTHSSTLQRG